MYKLKFDLHLFGNEEINMRESITPSMAYTNSVNGNEGYLAKGLMPFFSMRKLRLVYHQLTDSNEFEFKTFDSFKHQVLNSVAPQLELNKWQAIASRR